MIISEKIGLMGLVPVIVVDELEDALPTAKALIDGGLPIMEITLRTEQGIPAIKTIKENYPEMLIGAGTVLTVEQAQKAVEAGAEFIVSPGFNDEVVSWCQNNNILITPGCVTPTEIEHALTYGINILKFFPASIYGGIKGCSSLYGPYRMVKFIPTGGVDVNTLSEYADKHYIHAIGGGWLGSSKDIASKNYSKITDITKTSIDVLLGFEIAHIGINSTDKEKALSLAKELDFIFSFGLKEGKSSNFVGSAFEVMNDSSSGAKGHIAIKTNNVDRAVYYLGKKGFNIIESTKKVKNNKTIAVYLDKDFGGFKIHLLQK